MERPDRVVSLGEDVVVDLRKNNGSIPKFDDFGGIVENEINNKTAVDDRRHNNVDEEGNLVVNMAWLYRNVICTAHVSRRRRMRGTLIPPFRFQHTRGSYFSSGHAPKPCRI